jgi:hypothetical protein
LLHCATLDATQLWLHTCLQVTVLCSFLLLRLSFLRKRNKLTI